jgi:hypothetical protein
MNLSFASIAVGLLARPATLRRFEASQWRANGTFDIGPATETGIDAVVQASSQDDLRVLPEGERTDGYVTVWTLTEIRTSNETSGTTADEIVTETGERFRIVRVGVRPEGGYWRAIARKIEDHGRQ